MPKIFVPSPLRVLTQGKAELLVEASTVMEVLVEADKQYPGFKDRIIDGGGEVRRFVNIYVGSEDIRALTRLHTPLKELDEVSIVPAIAGG